VLAGAIGVGVGFGLQHVISNFVSGVIILAERPIAVGDRIEVAGVAGQVVKISLRSTTVVTNDNITVIVPNASLVTNAVTNWSHRDPKVRFRIPVEVAAGSDVERVRSLLLAVAEANPGALREPAPTVFFIGFGENGPRFELGVWTVQMARAPRRFRSEIYFAIERSFREHGVAIATPQREILMRPATALGDGSASPDRLPDAA
jgi:small-conductance mechanosensitive channel